MRPPKGGLVDAVDDQVPKVGGAGASSGKAFCRKCMCKAVSAEGQFEFAGYVGSLNDHLACVFYIAGILKHYVNVEL